VKDPQKVFLIGPMGAGKSTLGRLLSEELNLPFHDSDIEIEERSGADIAWIFDVEGEDGFRKREMKVIEELTQLPCLIMATGGGVVLREENRRNLQSRGTVVYLETEVERQYERTRRDRKRPLLREDDPKQKLTQLYQVRDPLYREIADLIVSTNRGNPKSVIRDIKAYLCD